MTDEVYGNIQNLAFSATRMTSNTLKQILSEFLRDAKQFKRDIKTPGKISLDSLKKSGYKLESIEINEGNIGDFKHIARKYDIDFALKRGKNQDGETRDFVFFKAKDVNTMKVAFEEYTAYTLTKNKKDKAKSYSERMKDAKEKQQERKEQGKDREKTRGQDMSTPAM